MIEWHMYKPIWCVEGVCSQWGASCVANRKKKKKERNPLAGRFTLGIGPPGQYPDGQSAPCSRAFYRFFQCPLSWTRFFLSKERKRNKVNFCMLLCLQGMPPWMPVCVWFFLMSHVCIPATRLSLSLTETSALHVHPHTRWMPSQSIQLQQKIPNSPSPPAQTQRKEQESIEMNGWASASWLELNGNVKLATDPLCLRVAGPVSLESTNRMMPSQWRSTPPRLPFWVTPLCLAERGREVWLKKKGEGGWYQARNNVQDLQWIFIRL